MSAGYVAIAEHPNASEGELYNAVNFAIRESITKEVQGVSQYQYRKYGSNTHVTCSPDQIADLSEESLREWRECCTTDFEEAVITLSWFGYSPREIARQLETDVEDIERIQRAVGRRYDE